jgi:hypothetical protein
MNERVLAQDWIPLRKAVLCLNGECETIFPVASIQCPACGGSACMPLQTWLKTVKEKS